MKKIVALSLVFVMTITILLSCGATDAPRGMKLASDTAIVDYSLYVPEDWIIDARDAYSQSHVSEADRSNVSVVQFNFTSEIRTIDSWWGYKDTNGELSELSYRKKLDNVLTDVTIIEEGTETMVSGVAAKTYIYTGKQLSSDTVYKFMVTAIAKNGSIYIITYTSTDVNGLYEKNLSTVKDKILANFKFN